MMKERTKRMHERFTKAKAKEAVNALCQKAAMKFQEEFSRGMIS